jgi:hypothetical protein
MFLLFTLMAYSTWRRGLGLGIDMCIHDYLLQVSAPGYLVQDR